MKKHEDLVIYFINSVQANYEKITANQIEILICIS